MRTPREDAEAEAMRPDEYRREAQIAAVANALDLAIEGAWSEDYRRKVARIAVDAAAGVLPQQGEPDGAEVERLARVLFRQQTDGTHTWEGIVDPGRDLWRHNARGLLCAAREEPKGASR